MRHGSWLSFGIVFGLLAGPSASAQSVSVDTRDEPIERCDQLRVTFDDEPAARAEQQLTVRLADAPTLTVSPPENGGVYVTGADRNDYAVTACKAARRQDQVERITVSTSGGTISSRGPSGARWIVYLLVKAPRQAALNLETMNGPINVSAMTGAVQARTTNGPIGLKDSTGRIDAQAQNGPIGFSGQGGDIRITAVNGPIDVRLVGERWHSGSLTARAENGPVNVRVAENYQSGVRVESSNHSPWSCKNPACRSGKKDWDDDSRSVELGSGPTVVRVSTVNGPVQIASSKE